jgi:hypothetical protein
MSYKDRLSPWCIIRHLPEAQRLVVARFRRRNNAEEQLRLLKRMTPSGEYSIIFDPMLERAEAAVQS